MAEQMQLNRPNAVLETGAVLETSAALDDLCPRCDADAVRVIVYGPLDFEVEAVDAGDLFGDAPIFDCRDCGFEWGLAVRDLLA